MLPDLQLAVRLQDLDNRVAELTREIAALPKHTHEIEKKLEIHERKLEADRAALSANQKERKQMEGEIQVQEQKISKLRGQMLDAKTNEQYRAFQNEIEFCEKEIRKAEDRQLELMQEAEPLERKVKDSEAKLKEEQAKVEIEKNTVRDRTAENKGFLEHLVQERETVAKAISPRVYSLYDRIRKKYGNAIAEGTQGTCTGCHMALRPQFFQELKRGDQLMTCESCGRI